MVSNLRGRISLFPELVLGGLGQRRTRTVGLCCFVSFPGGATVRSHTELPPVLRAIYVRRTSAFFLGNRSCKVE